MEVRDPSTPGHNLPRGSSKRGLSLEVLGAAQERGAGVRKEEQLGKGSRERGRQQAIRVSEKWRNACPPNPEPVEQVGHTRKVCPRCFGGGLGGRAVSTVVQGS